MRTQDRSHRRGGDTDVEFSLICEDPDLLVPEAVRAILEEAKRASRRLANKYVAFIERRPQAEIGDVPELDVPLRGPVELYVQAEMLDGLLAEKVGHAKPEHHRRGDTSHEPPAYLGSRAYACVMCLGSRKFLAAFVNYAFVARGGLKQAVVNEALTGVAALTERSRARHVEDASVHHTELRVDHYYLNVLIERAAGERLTQAEAFERIKERTPLS